jgi:hypothetical protein
MRLTTLPKAPPYPAHTQSCAHIMRHMRLLVFMRVMCFRLGFEYLKVLYTCIVCPSVELMSEAARLCSSYE